MSHVPPLGFNPKRRLIKSKITRIDIDAAALTYNPTCDAFPFTKHMSFNGTNRGENNQASETISQTECGKRVAEDKTAKRATYAEMVAEVKVAANEGVEAARPSLKESWVEVSDPILTESQLEVKDPNLQGTWVDSPPSRAPSCKDDNAPLPDLKGVRSKVEIRVGWLKSMGSALQC
jgi:hypothetical protein